MAMAVGLLKNKLKKLMIVYFIGKYLSLYLKRSISAYLIFIKPSHITNQLLYAIQ